MVNTMPEIAEQYFDRVNEKGRQIQHVQAWRAQQVLEIDSIVNKKAISLIQKRRAKGI